MKIEIKELELCRMNVNYEADAEQIMNKRAEVMESFKKAPVPGFRPGKASHEAIKSHYRSQIEDSLKRALAEDAYHNTLFEKKFRPHGAPKIKSALLADGKFICEFELFTKPNFELNSYKGMEIPKPAETISVTDLTEKMLQELRVRFGDTAPYTDGDFIQTGDSIIVDYIGLVDGIKLDNLCAEGEMLTVGQSQLPAFDDNLLGMSLNETRKFSLTVPLNGLPSLAGKKVDFEVTLNMGSKNAPCPLDDQLAEKLGKSSFIEVKEFVQGSAMVKVNEIAKNAITEAVANRLIQNNIFEVPNWLSLSEGMYLAHQSKLDWDTLADEDKERYMQMSEKNVRLSLILDKIREDEPEAQLTDQEVFDMIKQNLMNSKTQTPLDEVMKEMNRTGYLQILFSRIRDEHALDYIIKTAKIVE
jgi:trigger factor